AVLRRMQADGPRLPERADFADEADYLATMHSVPTWIAAQFLRTLGPQSEAALASVNRAPRAAVRVNTLRESREAVTALLQRAGVATKPSRYVADTLLVVDGVATDDSQGRWDLQAEAAAMPVDLLAPQAEETILELCSGRGHKTLQIAARIANRGRIVSVERDEKKMASLSAALERAGVTSVAAVLGDALEAASDVQADGVLIDAPCSGVGVIGRHPEARWRKKSDDGERLAATQRDLLRVAAARTRAGGRLVYSVCSIDPREGRNVVDAFLSAEPAFVRASLPARYAGFECAGDVIVPPGIDGRDGFYIATLVRCAESEISEPPMPPAPSAMREPPYA
ncbi:MAG: hypothetical protein M3R44_02040, partial [Candidatus Eremiobacteraeota bacterium]|nr:hypothetical protein [Candidatus Eremiobacteraeota bacterium]